LQGQAVFKTKLTFRPHSTKSATHKKMTNRLAMRHNQNQQKVDFNYFRIMKGDGVGIGYFG